MKLLEIKNVKKSFGAVDVLHDISLSVEQGEVVAIIGPSGSGKSTLLRCATLLETMDEGELVYLGEHAVSTGADGKSQYVGNAELKKIQGYFGLVFQNFNLFPHYSVLKNLMDAPVHVQKRNKEEVKKEAMELLEKMGLSDKADCYPCQLSGGQQHVRHCGTGSVCGKRSDLRQPLRTVCGTAEHVRRKDSGDQRVQQRAGHECHVSG